MKTITSNRLISFFVIVIFCGVSALVLTGTASSEGPKKLGAGKAKEAIRMFDIGLGPHAFNFQLGRETKTQYLGSAEMRQLAQSQQAQPRSMVTDDFNGDGMGDLVIGYANGNGGMLGLRQGNLQAIAPSDKEVFDGIGQGRYPSPFLTEVTLYSLPEAPDFLQVGDFDSDGYADVMAAARGGERMYLLSGDGHGQLRQAKVFEVAGQVTAMQAGREQRGRFTSLALGLMVPGGSTLSVYQEGGDGLASEPQSYTMPSEVTSLAYGDLNQDGTPDVAAAARNEVAVVYQNANGAADGSAPKEDAVERATFPFNVRGLTVGNFVFDRGHQMELALLADDGAIHLADKGSPDRREFTAAEIEFMRQQRIAWHKGQQDMDALTREMDKLVSSASKNAKQGAWKVTETLNTGAAPPFSGAPGLLQTAKMSGLSLDDLLVGNAADNSVQVVKNKKDVLKLKFKDADVAGSTTSVKIEGAPLAAVAMRVSVNGLPGMVVLQKGQTEPTVHINSPNAVLVVNTTADQIDLTQGNGVCNSTSGCSLRAAITESNWIGGSNAITVPNGTYTLTLGPFDDEFNTFGANMDSGDLDVIDLSFAGRPLLTAVTVNGGGRDTTIVQMGTLVPAGAGGINKDRVIESNNFVIPQHGTNLTLNNLTIQNGNAPRTPAPDNYNTKGGGIQYDGFDSPSATNLGVLTLTNTKFATNTSAGQGGGILAIFGGLTVQSTSIVSGNTTTFAAGGGIQHSGGNVITTTFTIDNSTIGGATVGEGNTANDASFGSGGGVDSVGANAFNITGGSVIRNNTAGVLSGPNGGGGVHIGNSKNIVFSTSTISDNKAKHNGGGIWVSARDAITNAASTITLTTMNVNTNQADSDNTLVGDGGGLYTFFGSATVQTTSHIDGNSANNGGGIFTGWTGIAADSTPALTVQTNSTIGQAGAGNGNSAKNNGGSLAMNPGAATTFGAINLNSLTFTNSTANSDSSGGGDGGAIFVGTGNITSLNNCTIDSNVANSGTGDGIFMAGGTITAVGTLTLAGDDSININGGTFTSTAGTFNLAGNFTRGSGGTFTHNGGTLNFNGAGAQNINGTATSETFNNFTVNKGGGTLQVGGSTTALTFNGAVTLTAGTFAAGTATAMGLTTGSWTNNGATFTPGSSVVSFTNAAAAQNINGSAASQTFNSITVNKTAQTLNVGGSTTALTLNGSLTLTSGTFAAGTAANINVGVDWTNNGGTFTPGTGTVTFNGGGAQSLTGSATTQTFNNFTVSKGGGTLSGSGSTNTLTIGGNFSITAGTFATGATLTTINDAGNWGNAGTFTPGASNTVIFNGNNSTQTLTGTTSFTNLTSNHTGTGGVTASGSTLAVTGLMRVQAGTFTSSSTFSNVQIDSGTTLVSDGGTMNVSGNWTNNGGTFTPATGTVNFNGGGAQTLGGTAATQSFNNFTVNKGGGALTGGGSTATLTIGGNLTLTAGTHAAGTATTINVAGAWANNGGTFNAGAGTVNFNGGAAQTISGTAATTFNNLTNSNASGLSMTNDNTATGVLALTSSDITVANTKTLTLASVTASTGTFDVIGSVKRNTPNPLSAGVGYTFGNPNNVITFAAVGTRPTDLTINLVKAAPSGGIGFPNAVNRTYTITPTGGVGFSATVQLHYLASELNGNTEGAGLNLWRFNGIGWAPIGQTANSTTAPNNWVSKSGVTAFSAWTFNSTLSPTAANAVISGLITNNDGKAVEGAVVNLSGTQSRKLITDKDGNYRFEGVETGGFYTVTPARANYKFNPFNRSFTQIGNRTEAVFTAGSTGDNSNPLDTPEYFVRQLYVDVLLREPDESGFNYWSDQILTCGNDLSCIRSKRTGVGAAFFIEQEAQQTGSYIYDVYAGALGRRPAFNEYSVDRAGVVGGATLDAAKTVFAQKFVRRAEFMTKYQGALTAETFVDALLQSVQALGVDLSRERRNLISTYNFGGDLVGSRAAVVRAIADDPAFKQSQYNQAFVLTEYFSFLQRDAEPGGYNFWVGVLNSGDPGNYRGMVCSFVTSREYQNRFSQVVSHTNGECGQ